MRKEETNEWVTISDLMAGVAAMIMLLLVVTIVQSTILASENAKKKRQGVESAITEIKSKLSQLENVNGILVKDDIIYLLDQSFSPGRACIQDVTKSLLDSISIILVDNLKLYPNIAVQIEGHTDPTPVTHICTDLSFGCALFDDNYSLSAGRAREARKALLSSISNNLIKSEISKRMAVVGYGPDHLLNYNNPTASENRRVEIRIIPIGLAYEISLQN
ncbi:MAG: hypothetical protein COW71_13085 [Ignavibacteriales bacterium CG18_big_fil_WC_8_21_14_2_50_31_20]|nr:MAG: hypothetical protein COW71_13085 [Ignavibacteriales bacterium CG18_big_fil_WC_8_21_14_2_50_31_20]